MAVEDLLNLPLTRTVPNGQPIRHSYGIPVESHLIQSCAVISSPEFPSSGKGAKDPPKDQTLPEEAIITTQHHSVRVFDQYGLRNKLNYGPV